MKLVSKKNGSVTIFPSLISAIARKIGFTPPNGMSSTNVQDAIEEVNGKTVVNKTIYTVPIYGGTVIARKVGNIVHICGTRIGETAPVPSGATYTFAILDAKYRPNESKWVMGLSGGNQNYNGSFGFSVGTDGAVTAYVYNNMDIGRFDITYIID